MEYGLGFISITQVNCNEEKEKTDYCEKYENIWKLRSESGRR